MAEPVDRLELVADEEHVLRGPAPGEQVDQLALERVRILELVDHDRPEAQLLGLEDPGVVREQVAGQQLEILEVECGLTLLAGRILGREQIEQLLEQILVPGRHDVERGLLDALARVVVGRGPRPARPERLEVDQPLRRRGKVERSTRGRELVLGRARIVDQALGGLAQLVEQPG